jgi:UDP-N-acetylglucosamine 2-epimerase (non-hydrolysing)
MKIAIIIGTRPEIIKMSPIIRICELQKLNYFVIHTGQHYSYKLDTIFFENLEVPKPKYNLEVGSGTHGEQTSKIIKRCEQVLIKEKPDIVLVEGDTNTVLGGALAASKLHIKVGHVEAGLRSYDRNMPEEKNRILTDHISDFLFCPTERSKDAALKEGINENKIFVTGNTIVDAVEYNLQIAEKKSKILEKLKIKKQEYFLLTFHRAENVDSLERLSSLIETLGDIFKIYKMPVIYPIHPRSRKMLDRFKINIPEGIKIIDPLDFFDFILCEKNARIVLTDSGGVQEEACILNVPCVTLRDTTERPETLEVGANILVSVYKDKIISAIENIMKKHNDWQNPFGDGKSGERIIQIVLKNGER